MDPRPALAALLLLAGCAGSSGGQFPSLQPRAAEKEREIAPPGAAVTPGLSAEEQASLATDLARIETALAATRRLIAVAETELSRLLPAGAKAEIGAQPWSEAQMALSRFDDARAPLSAHAAAVADLALQVDSLPAGDSDRQKVEQLAGTLSAEVKRTDSVAAAAERNLRL